MSVENSQLANEANQDAVEYQASMERNKSLTVNDLICVKNIDGFTLKTPVAGIIVANLHPMTKKVNFKVKSLNNKRFPTAGSGSSIDLDRVLDWSFGKVSPVFENEG